MRRVAPRPAARAFERVLGELAPATTLARVQVCWREVAGETVAEETEPLAERAGVVTVACRSSVWAQELALLAPDLVRRLNEALTGASEGPVAELRFRV